MTDPLTTLREALDNGNPYGEHDPLCASLFDANRFRRDEACNCSVRQKADALAALAAVRRELNALALAVAALVRERDWYRAALGEIAAQQPDTIAWMRAHGIVFDGPLGTDPDNWEHVAFSVYTDLCRVDAVARGALAHPAGEAAAATAPAAEGASITPISEPSAPAGTAPGDAA